MVIVTILPASAAVGVYVKEKGDTPEEAGLTDPAPFSAILRLVALPQKIFPLMVTGDTPHVLPELLLRDKVGGLVHPQVISKLVPVLIHPCTFITAILCVPFDTPVKLVDDWNDPPSKLY